MNYFVLVDKKTKSILSVVETTLKEYHDDRFLVISADSSIKNNIHNFKFINGNVKKYRNDPFPKPIMIVKK